jgi:phosphopantothenoylcysteine decarboxylase / phosphopantothenate---cysteine ligase
MKVLLGVTGCIGAYKAAEVLRGLQKAGAVVRVVMTRHATEFIRPLTFEALSGEPVITGMFERPDYSSIEHITVARDADLLLVAPATANMIAKFAHGVADDFLSTVYLSNTNPVLIAPAMNVEMWSHPATQANLEMLRERGVEVVEPESGYQACGEVGMGRLADVDQIVHRAIDIAMRGRRKRTLDLSEETVLVTAGPTVEAIDPVRYLSNRSSGRMGYAVAEAALARGARVVLVTGPTRLRPPQGAETIQVKSAREMFAAVMSRVAESTVFIGCAAVSDYRPVVTEAQKIKKQSGAHLTLDLEPTEDIIAAVGAAGASAGGREKGGSGRIVIGFAAESQSLISHAESKLREKGMDLIVANDITRKDAGFDVENNAATIIRRDGTRTDLPLQSKLELAERMLDEVIGLRKLVGTPT